MQGPAITPSRELEAVANRLMEALSEGDADVVMNLLSEDGAMLYVGTAEEEVWTADMLRRGFADFVKAIPSFGYSKVEVHAFSAGNIGWAFWTAVWRFAGSDQDIRFRTTMVFALEKGQWRVVHMHNSTPVSNVEYVGQHHARLEELVAAARESHSHSLSGVATIMFTDIANSAAIVSAIGDSRWLDLVTAHLNRVEEIVTRNGGKLVKTLGDGTMSTFGSASSAMSAAIAVQRSLASSPEEPRLQSRIGVHTGEVLQTTDDFYGTVVNKAARIASTASPGEIRVSDATRIMVGGSSDFAFSDLACVALKGLEGEHMVYRLDWRG
ncbi:hypothetical protein AVO45_10905 [Ruegeria marisrubri]|uniref:Guanylate cyclase domain-containing protein n=1 Tax=Ruegeria marisrubri TaxID=1685379 RepID=A0A0X3TRA5_9RHOB|nr:adenylate/guanylate cyclase domain-containing protein [Ruegeria marisrubri]KUJ76986.1 hypothetical protein AVO45_10905 [Ruegeria marisrubri]